MPAGRSLLASHYLFSLRTTLRDRTALFLVILVVGSGCTPNVEVETSLGALREQDVILRLDALPTDAVVLQESDVEGVRAILRIFSATAAGEGCRAVSPDLVAELPGGALDLTNAGGLDDERGVGPVGIICADPEWRGGAGLLPEVDVPLAITFRQGSEEETVSFLPVGAPPAVIVDNIDSWRDDGEVRFHLDPAGTNDSVLLPAVVAGERNPATAMPGGGWTAPVPGSNESELTLHIRVLRSADACAFEGCTLQYQHAPVVLSLP